MIYDIGVFSSARWRLPVMFTAAILALGAASPALANGRFPEAQRVLEHPGNPNRLYMAATFGLLVTEDRGKNWYTICEEAFALKFLEGDPLLEVMPDGSMLGGIFDTLNRSTDCGCAWKTTLGAAATESVMDIAIDRTTNAVVALVQDTTTFPGRLSVWESTDLGQTWKKLSDLPAEIVNGLTIDVAPSRSSRIYVSGVTRNEATKPAIALLAVSNDHGATWQMREVQGADSSALPYIAAVDATNPDKVYVRTDEWVDFGDFAANDALLFSDDAGQTWRELARHPAKLFGFALSPDGATVLIGYGDPIQAGGRTVNPDEMGIYKASTSAFTFDKIFSGPVNCLRWTSNGLYVCLTENHPDVPTPGMSLGFSPTVNFTLSTASPLTSLLAVKQVRGPLACTAALCTDNWKTGVDTVAPLCDLLAAKCDVDPSVNVLSCPAAPDGGTAGTGGAGGGGGTAGGAGTGGGNPAGTGGSTGTGGIGGGGKSGCGCAAAAGQGTGALAVLGMIAFAIGLRRRGHRSRQVLRVRSR